MEDCSNTRVEMSLNEAVEVGHQHEELRYSPARALRGLLAAGARRLRVVTWPNCSRVWPRVPRDVRNLVLFFGFTLTVAATNIFSYYQYTRHPADTRFMHFFEELVMSGMLRLVMFAVGFFFGLYVRKMMNGNTVSAPRRTPAVPTVSALVQQV